MDEIARVGSVKFLILGAGSFYGKAFTDLLRRRGDDFDLVWGPRYRLDKPEKNKSLTTALDTDCVVNFMSRSSVVESWDDPAEWMNVNVLGMTHLAELLRKTGVRKFIHVSTPEVYGPTYEWVTEDYPFKPTTPYAVSRASADMLLNAYYQAYGFPVVITRTANIYGVGQQSYRLIPRAFAGPIQIHGTGYSRRSFIHIEDACEATYLLCKRGVPGETYHISTNKAHQVLDVVRKIYDIKGEDFNPEFIEERLGKDSEYLLNSDKIRRLGWSDTITLEEGLNAYYAAEHERSPRISREA